MLQDRNKVISPVRYEFRRSQARFQTQNRLRNSLNYGEFAQESCNSRYNSPEHASLRFIYQRYPFQCTYTLWNPREISYFRKLYSVSHAGDGWIGISETIRVKRTIKCIDISFNGP